MSEIHGYIQVAIGSMLIPLLLVFFEHVKQNWKSKISIDVVKTFIDGLNYTRKPISKNGTLTYAFDDINMTDKIMTFLKRTKVEKLEDNRDPAGFELQGQGADWVGTIVGFKDNFLVVEYIPKGKFNLVKHYFKVG
jgi:hypothetical protein